MVRLTKEEIRKIRQIEDWENEREILREKRDYKVKYEKRTAAKSEFSRAKKYDSKEEAIAARKFWKAQRRLEAHIIFLGLRIEGYNYAEACNILSRDYPQP